jgi:hypothetical protein
MSESFVSGTIDRAEHMWTELASQPDCWEEYRHGSISIAAPGLTRSVVLA